MRAGNYKENQGTGHVSLKHNDIGRDFVCGDLQGCYDELRDLLSQAEFDESKDRLFCLGDLVDRGMKSLECLRLLEKPWFFSLKGNHEEMMLNAVEYPNELQTWYSAGGDWYNHVGFLASLIAVVTFVAGFFGWEFSAGAAQDRSVEIVQITDEKLRKAILELPEKQQKALAPLVGAILDLNQAVAYGGDKTLASEKVQLAVNEISGFTKEINFKSYSSDTSPFVLPLEQTVMLCNNFVSVGFQSLAKNTSRGSVIVNGKRRTVQAGHEFRVETPEGEAVITLMDVLAETQETVFTFRCP